jgi:hypothetical protein
LSSWLLSMGWPRGPWLPASYPFLHREFHPMGSQHLSSLSTPCHALARPSAQQ